MSLENIEAIHIQIIIQTLIKSQNLVVFHNIKKSRFTSHYAEARQIQF